MEAPDKNIFPKIDLFKPLDLVFKLGKFVTDRFYTDVPNTGASVVLDEYMQQEFEWPLESDGIEA